jgi:hypothetical protein
VDSPDSSDDSRVLAGAHSRFKEAGVAELKSEVMRVGGQTLVTIGSIAVVSVLGLPTMAAALTCRAFEGGAMFTPPEIREVPAAAVEAKGSEKCDVVYHVDGQRYQLGGCNREYVGEWSKRDGIPLGHRHGRLGLDCR